MSILRMFLDFQNSRTFFAHVHGVQVNICGKNRSASSCGSFFRGGIVIRRVKGIHIKMYVLITTSPCVISGPYIKLYIQLPVTKDRASVVLVVSKKQDCTPERIQARKRHSCRL